MMMTLMMTSTTSADEQDQEHEPINLSTTPACTSNWKLYENPFYQNPTSQRHFHKHLVRKYSASAKHIHRLHRDLKFDWPSPNMSSELDHARTQIAQLKDELESEKKMRKKAESLNKMMARELVDQRREKEKMSGDLRREITQLKSELEKKKKEIEAERKMLKMAEVLREERLQMKLSDAKTFYQEKFLQMTQKSVSNNKPCTASGSPSSTPSSSSSSSSSNAASVAAGESKGSSAQRESENPHIRRGIKGFVEFPRVVKKAMNGSAGSHSSRDMGTKLECQKAQLRILLKQKSSLSSNNLVIS